MSAKERLQNGSLEKQSKKYEGTWKGAWVGIISDGAIDFMIKS